MNKKFSTAKELSEHFEVSQRTIYRDIETLCQSGIPIYTTKGKGGGIGLMEQYVLNKSILTDKEQKDILVSLQGLKATNVQENDALLSKLNSLFGNKNTDWIEVDYSSWSSTKTDKEKFNLLKNAIINTKVIDFDYSNSKGQTSRRSVHPCKLMFKGQGWYLYGFCTERQDYRFFKITRIRSLVIQNETFQSSSDKQYEISPTAEEHYETMKVVIKIDSHMAFRVYDEFQPEDITQQEDGSFLITTNFIKGNWLMGYLMSYEDTVEILEPVALREQLIQIYQNALYKYL